MAQMNLIGKSILGYTVIEKLGSGAFGTVYKVVKTNEAGQYVRALKHITIPTEKQYNSVLNSMGGDASKADNYFSEMLGSIVSEIKILNDLSENGAQHIVRYYENDIRVTDTPKRYDIYILMEYLIPLDEYIKGENFSVRDVVRLGLGVLQGLKCCHDNGVIHRDIKDDNIFVSERGNYKIGDFGVSKIIKDSSKAESLKGTPNFIAPEVYLGKESYTKSVDLYSLGIVLYRLLNYNRNPFLPAFPKQYYAQDEDLAFEERMGGKIPGPPSLGGRKIGEVIVKAISDRSRRFQTADEFIKELEDAIGATPNETLNENIKFENTDIEKGQNNTAERQYGATMGEIDIQSASKESENRTTNHSINKHLFDSIGEIPSAYVPEEKNITTDKLKPESNANYTPDRKSGRIIDFAPQDLRDSENIVAVDKKVIGNVLFIIPVVVLLIGVIAYFIVIPAIYGKIVSFIDWLFTDPQNIIETLRDPNSVLPKFYSIVGIRIFWWIWLTGLITSLFFVGRQIHTKPKPVATNAILINRDPYLITQEVAAQLKQYKTQLSNKQFDSLISSMKRLEEKLSVESSFGHGGVAVINCENEIARQLQFLVDAVPYMENGNLDENIKLMNSSVMKINSLLRKRTELKKL